MVCPSGHPIVVCNLRVVTPDVHIVDSYCSHHGPWAGVSDIPQRGEKPLRKVEIGNKPGMPKTVNSSPDKHTGGERRCSHTP